MSEVPDNITNEGIPATGLPDGTARPGISDGEGNHPVQPGSAPQPEQSVPEPATTRKQSPGQQQAGASFR